MYTEAQLNILNGYTGFARPYAWNHYVTLTVARRVSIPRAEDFWREFHKQVERRVRRFVGWLRGDEMRWSGLGRPAIPVHFHALLIGTKGLPESELEKIWNHLAGDAQVVIYNPSAYDPEKHKFGAAAPILHVNSRTLCEIVMGPVLVGEQCGMWIFRFLLPQE